MYCLSELNENWFPPQKEVLNSVKKQQQKNQKKQQQTTLTNVLFLFDLLTMSPDSVS